MYIQQSELFWGMDRDFVKEVMEISVRESHGKGDFLFREGDPAVYFYLLIKGRVKLSIAEAGTVVHSADRPGDAFGWSSLIGRDVYSASGQCLEPVVIDSFHKAQFENILEKYPDQGLIFFKRLAGLVGNRLLGCYKMVTSTAIADSTVSFGSGQIQESEAAA